MNSPDNPWKKRFQRERAAKKAAETLLEEKSLELYNANQSLEEKVQERTQELEDALKVVQTAQKAKDAFLANMSHELRTPLNSIIGFSQILSKQKDVPEKLKGFIDKIHISGNSLLRLINSILDFSKLESDKVDLNKESINSLDFIKELLILVEVGAKKKNIIFCTDTDDIEFIADKQLLGQAITNLLSNAVKFSHENAEISLFLKQNQNEITITVCDKGIGITEENMQKLFTPFSQIDNEYQASVNGTGLGLYLTKKIIDLHGGNIRVESEILKGTCFYITLFT